MPNGGEEENKRNKITKFLSYFHVIHEQFHKDENRKGEKKLEMAKYALGFVPPLFIFSLGMTLGVQPSLLMRFLVFSIATGCLSLCIFLCSQSVNRIRITSKILQGSIPINLNDDLRAEIKSNYDYEILRKKMYHIWTTFTLVVWASIVGWYLKRLLIIGKTISKPEDSKLLFEFSNSDIFAFFIAGVIFAFAIVKLRDFVYCSKNFRACIQKTLGADFDGLEN